MEDKKSRVLLLASYCSDNPNCSEERPCLDCLGMCNVFEVEYVKFTRDGFMGNLDYLRDNEQIR